MLTVPQTRTTSVTARTAMGLPVTSKATSTPSPFVQSLTNFTGSTSGPIASSPSAVQQVDSEGLTSATTTRAPYGGNHRDEGADGPATEDEYGVTRLDPARRRHGWPPRGAR